MFFFFFSSRRRHTRYWRDWSSDVCSSDLVVDDPVDEHVAHQPLAALVQVLLVAPGLGLRAEVAVVVVEAVDELLAVDVALVLRPRVPQGDVGVHRSEERRAGKECRSRWWPY